MPRRRTIKGGNGVEEIINTLIGQIEDNIIKKKLLLLIHPDRIVESNKKTIYDEITKKINIDEYKDKKVFTKNEIIALFTPEFKKELEDKIKDKEGEKEQQEEDKARLERIREDARIKIEQEKAKRLATSAAAIEAQRKKKSAERRATAAAETVRNEPQRVFKRVPAQPDSVPYGMNEPQRVFKRVPAQPDSVPYGMNESQRVFKRVPAQPDSVPYGMNEPQRVFKRVPAQPSESYPYNPYTYYGGKHTYTRTEMKKKIGKVTRVVYMDSRKNLFIRQNKQYVPLNK
jgi:hypothetical protein